MVTSPSTSDTAAECARLAEFERNASCWHDLQSRKAERYRGKWILIYDGQTIHEFDHPADMLSAREALPDWQRDAAYHRFVRSRPSLPFPTSVTASERRQ